jgi:hypothetical protein
MYTCLAISTNASAPANIEAPTTQIASELNCDVCGWDFRQCAIVVSLHRDGPRRIRPCHLRQKPPAAAITFATASPKIENARSVWPPSNKTFVPASEPRFLDLRLTKRALNSAHRGGVFQRHSIVKPGGPQRVNACGLLFCERLLFAVSLTVPNGERLVFRVCAKAPDSGASQPLSSP